MIRSFLIVALFGVIARGQRECKLDILFVLDSSSSVRDDFQREIDFIQDISDMLHIEPDKHRVAIVEYAGNSKKVLRFPWDMFPDVDTFRNILNNLPHMSGTTFTARALKVGIEILKTRRPNVKTLVISVTDGYSWDITEPVMNDIRNLGKVTTFAASINDPSNEPEMLIMAGDESRIFRLPDPVGQARRVLEPHLRCETPKVTPKVTPKPATPKPATAAPSQPPQECRLDLTIFLDSSGRSNDFFNIYRDLAGLLVDSLVVKPDAMRVALVTFAEFVTPVFHMNTYSNKPSVKDAIRRSVFTPGYRSVGEALREGIREFDPQNGARRPGAAAQVAVILTNGYSCDDPAQRAQELRDKGVIVYVISIAGNAAIDAQEVRSITQDDTRLFTDESFDRFLVRLKDDACDQFAQKKTSIFYQPSPPPYRKKL